MFKAGFARVDITPALGLGIAGYYSKRISNGVLDPLYATAVAFSDGKKLGLLLSVDIIGITQGCADIIRKEIAESVGTSAEGVFIGCTHIHTGPLVEEFSDEANILRNAKEVIDASPYAAWLVKRLVDVCRMAADDMAEGKMYVTSAEVKDVAFIRRYRMKDGSVRTNPGWQNPDVLEKIGKEDETATLLIIKREGKKEIGIVNFQVHPDVIGGAKFSADYPKFVRDTYERNVPNSLCMYLNGPQGDTNHIDIRLHPEKDPCTWGYDRARYMGKKIAMSVLSNYELAREIQGGKVDFAQTLVDARHNKGAEEDIPWALELAKRYREVGANDALPHLTGMQRTQQVAKALRIERLKDYPDERTLRVSALRVGDVIFGGYPGEPFTEMGTRFKEASKFPVTIAACIVNGYEGYFPMQSAFDDGAYESFTTRFGRGTAENLVAALIELSEKLYKA
ncbi:MAG: neutral/alkaline non-lysosomal ceramidase N-terminal domain-containing protein [Clostridia bacterium]|nr:neutral/alkaline non-lysosomal ceramidase N-terminal domain-containing protein [Clostridia bacterium]